MAEQSKSAQIKTHLNELVKTYTAYDVNGRPEYVYTAAEDAEDGAPCLVTRYSYDGTSQRVVYLKESNTTWQTAWETF